MAKSIDFDMVSEVCGVATALTPHPAAKACLGLVTTASKGASWLQQKLPISARGHPAVEFDLSPTAASPVVEFDLSPTAASMGCQASEEPMTTAAHSRPSPQKPSQAKPSKPRLTTEMQTVLLQVRDLTLHVEPPESADMRMAGVYKCGNLANKKPVWSNQYYEIAWQDGGFVLRGRGANTVEFSASAQPEDALRPELGKWFDNSKSCFVEVTEATPYQVDQHDCVASCAQRLSTESRVRSYKTVADCKNESIKAIFAMMPTVSEFLMVLLTIHFKGQMERVFHGKSLDEECMAKVKNVFDDEHERIRRKATAKTKAHVDKLHRELSDAKFVVRKTCLQYTEDDCNVLL